MENVSTNPVMLLLRSIIYPESFILLPAYLVSKGIIAHVASSLPLIASIFRHLIHLILIITVYAMQVNTACGFRDFDFPPMERFVTNLLILWLFTYIPTCLLIYFITPKKPSGLTNVTVKNERWFASLIKGFILMIMYNIVYRYRKYSIGCGALQYSWVDNGGDPVASIDDSPNEVWGHNFVASRNTYNYNYNPADPWAYDYNDDAALNYYYHNKNRIYLNKLSRAKQKYEEEKAAEEAEMRKNGRYYDDDSDYYYDYDDDDQQQKSSGGISFLEFIMISCIILFIIFIFYKFRKKILNKCFGIDHDRYTTSDGAGSDQDNNNEMTNPSVISSSFTKKKDEMQHSKHSMGGSMGGY